MVRHIHSREGFSTIVIIIPMSTLVTQLAVCIFNSWLRVDMGDSIQHAYYCVWQFDVWQFDDVSHSRHTENYSLHF